MRFKPFDELSIQDNFIFEKVMREKSICKELLERVLEISIRDIAYIETEKTMESGLDEKGIRLDVYVNDDKGTVYNIEMQTYKNMPELIKRSRFYHSAIDHYSMEKGADYMTLNDCFVIFICTFPIFSGKRHKYTYTKKCTEEMGRELGDGLTTIFLSTKAEMDDVSEVLLNFLDYVDGRPPADGLVQQMDEVVHIVKQSKEWRGEYMKLEMDRKKYWREGKEEGKLEGKEEGRLEVIVGMFREKLSVEMIARITNMSVEQVIKIGKEHALL